MVKEKPLVLCLGWSNKRINGVTKAKWDLEFLTDLLVVMVALQRYNYCQDREGICKKYLDFSLLPPSVLCLWFPMGWTQSEGDYKGSLNEVILHGAWSSFHKAGKRKWIMDSWAKRWWKITSTLTSSIFILFFSSFPLIIDTLP